MDKAHSGGGDTFPERLRLVRRLWEAREGGPATDQDFAVALGLTPQNFSGVKNSLKPPPYDRVRDMAQRMDVDPGWLMFGAESDAPAPQVPSRPSRSVTGTLTGIKPDAVGAKKTARKREA